MSVIQIIPSAGRRDHHSQCCVLRDFITHGSDRNTKRIRRASSAPIIVVERIEDEFTLNLLNRVSYKIASDVR
jgi:hypothetical protein